jgi:hypothetical protein
VTDSNSSTGEDSEAAAMALRKRAPESGAPAGRASGFQTLSQGALKFAVLLGFLRFGSGHVAGQLGLVNEPRLQIAELP